MTICPSGHESASADFCDVCGFMIGAPASLAPEPPAGEQCPRCGAARTGRFCEGCGYAYPAPSAPAPSAPAPPVPAPPVPEARAPVMSAPVTYAPVRPASVTPPGEPAGSGAAWTAVVTADRAYYDSVRAAGGQDAAAITFPVYSSERRFRLTGTEARIGRRSTRSGIDPEIDLTGPPADPGVSRLHAVLIKAADGSWAVLDPGSANGTLVNGTAIPRDTIVPLGEGDRVHLGAWTELTIVRDG